MTDETAARRACLDRATPAFGDSIGPWAPSFAWLPHWTFDAGWVWLVPVWRRMIQKHYYLDGGADFWWQYRRGS